MFLLSTALGGDDRTRLGRVDVGGLVLLAPLFSESGWFSRI